MSDTIIYSIAIFFAGLVYCLIWFFHIGHDKNVRTVFLVSGLVVVSLGLLGLLYGAYKRYFVDSDDDDANNDHHDHGLGTSGDHVITNITELASVSRCILIRSIPAVDFNPRNFKDAECVVCISELEEGDKAKLLPSCKHWFHAHCIDAWLESHATCPICRTRVRLFRTNEPASSGKPTCSDERSADVTEVVIDIPTNFEAGDLGPLHP